jgi:hypothetical protein
MLTVAYLTNRKESKIEWFLHSFANEVRRRGVGWDTLKLVVVDFHISPTVIGSRLRLIDLCLEAGIECAITLTPPKPSIVQGPHRLTPMDCFDASNARNTALCYAPDGYIAYVDDLSVMLPGWLDAVLEAQSVHYVACGAYRKVKDLVVSDGEIQSFTHHTPGEDHRLWHKAHHNPCPSNWLYGCSAAIPVEALELINGWPEDFCQSLSYEDSVTGQALAANGYIMRYDPRMMTYESEEHHHVGTPFFRWDPGVSPNDKSHALLDKCRGLKRFPNHFGGGFQSIHELRKHVLSGGEFPVRTEPTHEWFTGKRWQDIP